MAKKRGKKVPVGQLSKEQQAAFQAQLDLQERALRMAQAQADREAENYAARVAEQRAQQQAQEAQARENADREAQFNALNEVARIYSGQAGDYGSQYDAYAGQVESQRQGALQQLADAVARAESGIGSAQDQFLRDLVATQAYQNVPLVELGQQQNPLLAGLAAEGASAAGVEAQSAQDAQIAAQLAALTRGAMGQLNVGEQNYMKALQNAAAQAASQARTDLSGRQFGIRQGIQSQYDQLAQQIAQQRLESVSAAERQAAEARAQAQAYKPIEMATPMPTIPEPEFNYAAQLEAARQAALAQIRAALPTQPTKPKPKTATGSGTGTTGVTSGGGVRDILGNLQPANTPKIG